MTQQFKFEYETVINPSRKIKKIPAPSELLRQICSFVRGHQSLGEKNFLTTWLEPSFKKMGVKFTKDKFGNYCVRIDGKWVNKVLHLGHLDTLHSKNDNSLHQKGKIDKDNFMTLDFKHYGEDSTRYPSCLGADDGCAIAVMLYMLAHGVSGTYVFTRGEEVGCLGAKYLTDNFEEFFSQFDMAIEVDREGTEEIIVEQSTGMCASEAFGDSLAVQLGMGHENSDRGVITDAGYFNALIPECVNLAAGYENQHGDQEVVDLTYIDVLADQLVKVDFSALTINRDTSDFGYSHFSMYDDWHLSYQPKGKGTNKYETYTGQIRKKSSFVKHIDAELLKEIPELESGLSLDDLSDDEYQDLRDLGCASPWFHVLNHQARVELMEYEFPVYTGVPADHFPEPDLEETIMENAWIIAEAIRQKKMDLSSLGLDDVLPDITDFYKGGL